jgi:hypothetical protein
MAPASTPKRRYSVVQRLEDDDLQAASTTASSEQDDDLKALGLVPETAKPNVPVGVTQGRASEEENKEGEEDFDEDDVVEGLGLVPEKAKPKTVKKVDVEVVLEGKNLESVTMRLVRREKRLQLEEGSLEAEDQKEKARKKMFKIIGSALAAQLERRKQAG